MHSSDKREIVGSSPTCRTNKNAMRCHEAALTELDRKVHTTGSQDPSKRKEEHGKWNSKVVQ